MRKLMMTLTTAAALAACTSKVQQSTEVSIGNFDYNVEQFADIQILRYRVPGFEELTLQQKKMLYYLSEAAIQGRDIFFDQNGKYNLSIRRTLEAIYAHARDKECADYKALEEYLKRVWFSSGIYHHYSSDKFMPSFSEVYFREQVKEIDTSILPTTNVDELLNTICPIMFDSTLLAKRLNQADGEDLILTSAGNYYEGITQAEAEAFYAEMKNPNDSTPISYGLNSRLIKKDGKIVEEVYRIGGRYSNSLTKIVASLQKASQVAENDKQKEVIESLIKYYQTGDLREFDQYSILWAKDVDSRIDFVNGFIETYGDPLGMKASWESMVNFKNLEATKRAELISNDAQWFEDNSPVDQRFKKPLVKGVSAKVITAAMLGGDCYPATPIGINLPNANWIRLHHGSKSVTVENITEAYDKASLGNGFTKEFAWSNVELDLLKKYGFTTDNLHTDLHECLGHGSGQLLPGTDPDALKAYGSTIEEARADLFALYYVADKKMVELGLLPNEEAYKAEFYKYMMNGLMTQLTRISLGNNIEESHMRNRQLIARYALCKSAEDKAVELKKRDGKTYVVVNDYEKLRDKFAELLSEIQRIKSEGDFAAARQLVESYAVKVDSSLHKEILDRFAPLNVAPYRGFLNPIYVITNDKNGEIIDITLDYTEGYAEQMMRYSKDYSFEK